MESGIEKQGPKRSTYDFRRLPGLKSETKSGTKKAPMREPFAVCICVRAGHGVAEDVFSWANGLGFYPLRLEFLLECRAQAEGDTQHP